MPHRHRNTNTGPGSVASAAEAGNYLSRLTLAGREAFDEASASGSKGHNSPPPELSNFCTPACGTKAQYQNSGSSTIINNNIPSTPSRGPTLLYLCAGKEKKKKNKTSATRPTPTHGGGSNCLRSSGGLHLALHRGATAGGPATSLQAGAAARRLITATTGGAAAQRRAVEAR